MKKFTAILTLFFTLAIPLAFAQPNILSVTIDTEYNVPYSIDRRNDYLSGWDGLTPIITTYIDHNYGAGRRKVSPNIVAYQIQEDAIKLIVRIKTWDFAFWYNLSMSNYLLARQ